MKYVKMLGLVAVAAAALMAFVGASSASATVLCTTETHEAKCPIGWAAGSGHEIHAVSEVEKPTLTGGFKNIECESSTVSGIVENEGSATETVRGSATVTFTNCNCTVVVVSSGTLEIHWKKPGAGETETNGTLTSSGATVTVNCSTIFGNVHCNYKTEETDLGTLTGSSTTKETATMDITAEIPRETTSSLCNEMAIWHAKYKVTTPDYLDVANETG